MPTIGKSAVLGAAFLAGVAIAACQQRLAPRLRLFPPPMGRRPMLRQRQTAPCRNKTPRVLCRGSRRSATTVPTRVR
jgi:hypothetical protein